MRPVGPPEGGPSFSVGVHLLVCVAGAGMAMLAQGPASTIRLVDAAAQAGLTALNVHGSPGREYIIDTNGNGAAWFDFDNDNDVDALLVSGSTRQRMAAGGDPMAVLYRNDGNGRFTDVTRTSGLVKRGWGMGVCVADYDNDGFADVYLTAFGANVLYRNTGSGSFADVTASAGVGDTRWSTNCAFGDYDRDGDVDLYVANYVAFDEKTAPAPGSRPNCRYGTLAVMCGPRGLPGAADVLYRNDGSGRFTDVTQAAGIVDPGHYGFGVLFSDLSGDGWPDIFVANDSVPNLFFRNNRNGTFVEEGLLSGLALSGDGREQAGMGVDAGDINGDGRLDLIQTNFTNDYNTVRENNGGGVFTDITHASGMGTIPLPYLGWGVGLVDVDNDGLLDVFVANGHVHADAAKAGLGTTFLQRKLLFQNVGNARFRHVAEPAGGGVLIERSSRGAAFGDYDNDGDVDILVVNLSDRPTLLRNETGGGHHWMTLQLAGTKSNRNGIGARVQVRAGGRTQIAEVRSGGSYLSHNDMRARFGLGTASRVEAVEIRWPSGLVDKAGDLAADRFYVAEEGRGVRPLPAR